MSITKNVLHDTEFSKSLIQEPPLTDDELYEENMLQKEEDAPEPDIDDFDRRIHTGKIEIGEPSDTSFIDSDRIKFEEENTIEALEPNTDMGRGI